MSMRRLQPANWTFLFCSPFHAAASRLWGAPGEAERTTLMREAARHYNRINTSPLDEGFAEPRGYVEIGVAWLDEDGEVVAAYYGPADPRNTALDMLSWRRQREQRGEVKATVNRVTADLIVELPQAARAPKDPPSC